LALEVVKRFDGETNVARIAHNLAATLPAPDITTDIIVELATALDEALLLDSPRIRAHLNTPIRKPTCLGSYSADPTELRAQLKQLFHAPGGPGLPGTQVKKRNDKLRAILAPHMDYGRGGITYGHAFKELIENTDARVFVIVATSHYSSHRYTLSRQNFDTPLGLVETDQNYVNRIEEHYGDGLFDDPFAHHPEHSIELEVVLLRYLLGDHRPFKIVPLLTGPTPDFVRGKFNESEAQDIARMVAAIRAAEAACAEPVCYLISGDLAHIGPKFGDKRKAAGPWLVESRTKDESILKTLDVADPRAFVKEIAAEQNSRRICGLSPTWLTLEVTKPRTGKVLHYQQYVHPQGDESVSFAAAAFYE
jgi:AmmeMemoRadiSam system protein B